MTPSHRLDPADFRRMVEEAKARHNLSDIVGEYTKLKRRSPREQVGLCPFHEERSPSFEVNDDKGTYHCWGCGAGGDALRFLMMLKGLSFRDAYEALASDRFPTVNPEEVARRRDANAAELAARIDLARSIWARGVDPAGTPAEVYAKTRGITGPLPSTVRFVMTPRWRDPEAGKVGRDYPAMACALQDAAGQLVGVQCIFLEHGGRRKFERVRDDGTKSKAKLTFGQVIGAAFRATGDEQPGDQIVVCEGPEDGLTLAQELAPATVFATCGTDLMPRLVLPEGVGVVVLAGDNNNAGRAAVDAAATAFGDQGVEVRTMYPAPAFKDWNDELRGIAA